MYMSPNTNHDGLTPTRKQTLKHTVVYSHFCNTHRYSTPELAHTTHTISSGSFTLLPLHVYVTVLIGCWKSGQH